MGVRIGLQCFSSQSDADDFYYAGQPVISMNKADSSAFMMFQKIDGKWYQAFYNSSSQMTYKVVAPTLQFGECSATDSFIDGASIGFLIMAVMVIPWGYRMLARYFDND